MKPYLMCLPALLCITGVAFAAVPAPSLQSDEQKLSYAMGLDLGEYFKSLDATFDLDVMQQGIKDGYLGNPPLLSAAEIAELQQEFARSQQEKQIRETLVMIEKNRQEAEEFLKANKDREGVIETPSGLQYKVMDKGAGGAKPQPTDTVKVQYTGTLLDGTEFDSSYKRNEPAVFQVDQVIAGWQEALPLMEVGATHELYIPPDLAYGDRGVPPVIEPGSMLIFQVELLEIQESDDSALLDEE
ncbi:FKBP-type peptidyl-prolyl cis-trans isomerase [Desulfobulbus alkaliphilus]|uniref:FKBP-type peptidyl-prolyl cis-trans isomerase n=1 Tax=Desulfobulbus alkaliphilus TaxID=869814 RepID=UPI001965459D|nr:FKBP-type peptidyl-prolyl cis-trans isomerase [Desulfobulbus alkaliphilus]MBM9536137.1 FKBP-type peptidyl-prolyl cis-trans isomerase [Desulfobulbus alkaliphilus]